MDRGRIIFDLDGTLVDASDRMYLLFKELVPGCLLSKEEYWAMKRDKVSHRDILMDGMGYSGDDIEDFERRWMNEIEGPKSIARDRLYSGVLETLNTLRREGFKLYLVTARQFPSVAMSELKTLGIQGLFDGVFVTGPDRDKFRALESIAPFCKRDVFVGDTGKDIQLGKAAGGFTVAIADGFVSAGRLREYSPDVIINSIGDLTGCRILN